MNWSIDRRFSRGLFLTPELLGFDRDEEGNLIINPSEAETVKVIYYLFLNGFSLKELSELLTEYGRKTKLGNQEWSTSSLVRIMQNERHCGDILARKTYTPSYLNQKSKKNQNNRTQYRK
jgi:site-specific DNA recombinase